MSIYNLGRVLPIFMGEFDENETYNNLDVVLYNGSSYVANDTVTNVLPTNDEYWTLVAQAGTLSPDQIASIERQVIQYVQSQGYVIDNNYVHTDNNYTNADKNKLAGIDMTTKQDTLVSGTNIKTVNNQSLLGSGNISIEGGTGTTDYTDLTNKPSINNVTLTGNKTTAQLGINIPTKTSDLTNDSNFVNTTQLNTAVGAKQDTLVSGTNIKTVNNQSLLGSGNITISGGGGGTTDYTQLSNKPSINNVELSGNKTTSDLGINIPTKTSDLTNDSNFVNTTQLNTKQDTLVSGTNIKTVNNESLLGSGNITISGGATPETITVTDTTYTIATLDGNKIYNFSNALTALTVTAFGDTTAETIMYFTAGNNFALTMPASTKYIIEQPTFVTGTDYIISIKNNTLVMGEIV